MYVRWRPLSTHSRKRFWKFCITRCSMLVETAATSSLGFFSYTLLLRYPQRKKYCDYGHSFRWLLKCRRNIRWVTTTASLFLKIVSTAKTRSSTDQRSMAIEMLWVSLEGRSRTNSSRQRFHSQLCYQIVRYFCRTLYDWFPQWLLPWSLSQSNLVHVPLRRAVPKYRYLTTQRCVPEERRPQLHCGESLKPFHYSVFHSLLLATQLQ